MLSAPVSPVGGAGMTMRRIGSPGGASSGGTTRSAGIAIGRPAASTTGSRARTSGSARCAGRRRSPGGGGRSLRAARSPPAPPGRPAAGGCPAAGRRRGRIDAGLVQALDHFGHRRRLARVHEGRECRSSDRCLRSCVGFGLRHGSLPRPAGGCGAGRGACAGVAGADCCRRPRRPAPLRGAPGRPAVPPRSGVDDGNDISRGEPPATVASATAR